MCDAEGSERRPHFGGVEARVAQQAPQPVPVAPLLPRPSRSLGASSKQRKQRRKRGGERERIRKLKSVAVGGQRQPPLDLTPWRLVTRGG